MTVIRVRNTTPEQKALEALAMDRYNKAFGNLTYTRATVKMSTRYANLLIDDALATCGHPFFRKSNIRWGAKARAFLARFENKETRTVGRNVRLEIDHNCCTFSFYMIDPNDPQPLSVSDARQMDAEGYVLESSGFKRI